MSTFYNYCALKDFKRFAFIISITLHKGPII